MKNLIPIFIAMIFVLSSCKKEHKKADDPSTPGSGKQYQLTFNVTNQELKTQANKTKVNAVTTNSQVIKYLHYFVYDSNRTLVRHFTQDSTTFNFGVVSDAFFPGKYTLVFFGTQYPLQDDLPSHPPFPPRYELIRQPEKHDDFFHKKIDITVTDTNINQDVTLERMGAKLQVVLLDSIPPDLVFIDIQYRDYATFGLRTGFTNSPTGDGGYRVVMKPSDAGKKNYTISVVLYKTSAVFNSPQPLKITITPYDVLRKYKPVVVNDVLFERNQVTVLKGKLFQNAIPDYNSGFQITLDPDWGPTTTNNF